ncbi:hypothetical protein AAY473_011287 [Plecturocebus cupreus]
MPGLLTPVPLNFTIWDGIDEKAVKAHDMKVGPSTSQNTVVYLKEFLNSDSDYGRQAQASHRIPRGHPHADVSAWKNLTRSPECGGTISAHCNLCLLGSAILLPQPPEKLGLQGTGFHHIGQAGLKLLTSGDPPALAFQSAEITGVSHHALPEIVISKGYAQMTLRAISKELKKTKDTTVTKLECMKTKPSPQRG